SSVSIAVAVGFPGEHSASDLMSRVSHALSSIRAAGGNHIAMFRDDLAETFDLRTDIELNLHRALEDEELALFFQPEVDLRSGAIVALESLAQWDHPTRGPLSAEQFMPVAEATNQAATLGRRILWLCCQQLHRWRKKQLAQNMLMRIKLSPAQVLTENFVAYLVETLENFELPASTLSLEFPESDLFYEPSVSATLRNLKATGVSLTLADFGTGYSTLAGLKSLPFDTIKIDESFVRNLQDDDGNTAIVESISALSEAFDLDLVASGLQNCADAEVLAGLGCQQAQGPFVSAPLDITATTTLLEKPLIPHVKVGD
ncbi:EAL domain-containing protein, partial [Mycolicibacterium llatzerense]|uniref:EAL domain-containing protein n=1 Tax=Mycolicibacterium llatzerense TaxID=280871 RepID=UPI000B12AFDF